MSIFVPSKYQQAIFDWATAGRGDALVEAVAGSGKTTTLVEMSKRIKTGDALFVAFNVKIVKELQARLGSGFTATTINSLGNRALMKHLGKSFKGMATPNKYNRLAYTALKDMVEPKQVYPAVVKVESLIGYAMADMSDLSDASLAEIADHFGYEYPKALGVTDTHNLVRNLMKTGEAMARQGIVNFDEQVYLPVLWGLRPVQSAFVMVDECQDLSKAKLLLVMSARAAGGRMCLVGDRYQSIYGFAGADARSIPNIIEKLNPTIFTLPVSYRCAKAIVMHAQEIVPHIESTENAPEGCVDTVAETYLLDNVKNGDLILCRLTAPLISLCIRLIAQKIPARVKGRNVATQLVNLVREALGARPWSELNQALDDYLDSSVATLLGRQDAEKKLTALNDKVAGIRACVEGFRSPSFEAFKTSLESIFTDDSAMVELSTIHSMKGGEADTVYIVKPEALPLTWKNQQPWEAEQEENICYVARTRAKTNLLYVKTPN